MLSTTPLKNKPEKEEEEERRRHHLRIRYYFVGEDVCQPNTPCGKAMHMERLMYGQHDTNLNNRQCEHHICLLMCLEKQRQGSWIHDSFFNCLFIGEGCCEGACPANCIDLMSQSREPDFCRKANRVANLFARA